MPGSDELLVDEFDFGVDETTSTDLSVRADAPMEVTLSSDQFEYIADALQAIADMTAQTQSAILFIVGFGVAVVVLVVLWQVLAPFIYG